MITFDKIVENYDDGAYTISENIGWRPEKLPEGTIIDEEKSVRWTREEVERINVEKQEHFMKMKQLKNERYEKFKADIFAAAKDEYNINKAQAQKIFSYVWERGEHDYMCTELVRDIERFCDFFAELVEAKEED